MDNYKNIRIKIIFSYVYSRFILGIVIQIAGRCFSLCDEF